MVVSDDVLSTEEDWLGSKASLYANMRSWLMAVNPNAVSNFGRLPRDKEKAANAPIACDMRNNRRLTVATSYGLSIAIVCGANFLDCPSYTMTTYPATTILSWPLFLSMIVPARSVLILFTGEGRSR